MAGGRIEKKKKKESHPHPHLSKRGKLNMINKLDLLPFSFTLLRTQMPLFIKKKKREKQKNVCPTCCLWKTVQMTRKLALLQSHKH